MQARECFAGIFALAFFMIAIFVYFEHQYKSDTLMKFQTFHGCDCNGTRYEKSISAHTTSSNTEISLDIKSIINLPAWLRDNKQTLTKDTSLEKLNVSKAIRGQDNEEVIAWENFFFGMSGGLMLELGARDGIELSVSHFFEKSFLWKAILIEGNPFYASDLSKNRPNALNFNVAICDKPAQVHYFSNKEYSGILEFMSQGFLKQCYASVLKIPKNGTLDLEKLKEDKHVSQIQCLPLANILTPFKINHLNFFVLDVEGGELNILRTIDFDAITFDVIAIETNRFADNPTETKPYVDAVSELMISKGYIRWAILGRNSWFLHPDFKPSAKPKPELT